MRAKVRYARRAISDLLDIADYIRERNPRAAEAVAESHQGIDRTARNLSLHRQID